MPSPLVVVDETIVDDAEQRRAQLTSLVRKYVPIDAFRHAPEDAVFNVSVLSGGITNQLYRVQSVPNLEGERSHAVVVRVFGKETDRIISRDSELFYQSLFLKTFCQGKNFLVYEFLTGFKDIEFTEMLTHRLEIAEVFAEFHLTATAHSKLAGRFENEVLSCVHTLRAWFTSAFEENTLDKLTPAQRSILADAQMTRENVQTHVSDLLSIIGSLSGGLVEGVCHNDLLSANIMRRVSIPSVTGGDDGKKDLVFIDFEYGNRNYLLYDLANHFNEYVGLECQYETYFPNDDVIFEFICAYRAAMRKLLNDKSEHNSPFGSLSSQFFCQNCEDENARCLLWVKHVKVLTLASHAMWSCWAILQAAHSVIEFDFTTYATHRWQRFQETKAPFVAALGVL